MKKLLLLASCLIASVSMIAQDNLIAKANEGATGDSGAMAANGWQCWTFSASDNTSSKINWNSNSNGPAGNNVRWENRPNDVTYEGKSYTGNVAFTRWDGTLRNAWYVFPVEITTPGTYRFSVLAGGWSNLNGDKGDYLNGNSTQAELMMLFSKEIGPLGIHWNGESEYSVLGLPEKGMGEIFNLPKTDANDKATLVKCEVEVEAPSAGTYYVEILGSRAIIVTADYQLTFVEGLETSTNLLSQANKGETGDKGAMGRYGWEYWKFPYTYNQSENSYTFGNAEKLPWNNNGANGNNVRWENYSSTAQVSYEGQTYEGNVAIIRWDNGSCHSNWYVYPVEITTPGTYNLSVLAGPWSNISADDANSPYLKGTSDIAYFGLLFSKEMGPQGIQWNAAGDQPYSVLGEPAEGAGEIFALQKTDANNNAILTKCETQVSAPTAGTYYVELIGSHSILATADYSLTYVDNKVVVTEIEDAAEVVEIEYYGIDGVRLVKPTKGSLVIEKRVMSNGNIKVRKSIVR